MTWVRAREEPETDQVMVSLSVVTDGAHAFDAANRLMELTRAIVPIEYVSVSMHKVGQDNEVDMDVQKMQCNDCGLVFEQIDDSTALGNQAHMHGFCPRCRQDNIEEREDV